jgi:PTH2 family peptidyl-tRNA hydrolase
MYNTKMMIVMRRDLKMRKGKIAAQAGHACIEALLMAMHKEGRLADLVESPEGMMLRMDGREETPLTEWFGCGVAKICVYVDSEEELMAIANKAEEMGIITALITDAGATEFHGVPTRTCLALEPLPASVADTLTGGLPLY